MKNFIPINENINEETTLNNFLDNLDSDLKTSVILEENENVEEKEIELDEIIDSETLTVENESQEQQEECTALVVTKPNSLFVAQKMFKKSIKISIKSFLISLSLGFLNLFI